MKKNGFTVVELVAAFALTMIISIFLFEVLIDVKDIFIETSIKTNIEERLSIISKNIKYNVPEKGISSVTCDAKSCTITKDGTSKIITIENDEVIIAGQHFKMPEDVTIKAKTINNKCVDSDCYINVKMTLTNENLSSDYEYNVLYYYTKN